MYFANDSKESIMILLKNGAKLKELSREARHNWMREMIKTYPGKKAPETGEEKKMGK